MRDILHAHAEAKRPALRLEFAGVSHVASSGLATLVGNVRLAREFGGEFALAAMTERCGRFWIRFG